MLQEDRFSDASISKFQPFSSQLQSFSYDKTFILYKGQKFLIH